MEEEDCDKRNSGDSVTILKIIGIFENNVEITRMSLISDAYKDQLIRSLQVVKREREQLHGKIIFVPILKNIGERTQDFTDSAYTTHERRQNILLLCDRGRVELTQLLRMKVRQAIQFLRILLIIKFNAFSRSLIAEQRLV